MKRIASGPKGCQRKGKKWNGKEGYDALPGGRKDTGDIWEWEGEGNSHSIYQKSIRKVVLSGRKKFKKGRKKIVPRRESEVRKRESCDTESESQSKQRESKGGERESYERMGKS